MPDELPSILLQKDSYVLSDINLRGEQSIWEIPQRSCINASSFVPEIKEKRFAGLQRAVPKVAEMNMIKT